METTSWTIDRTAGPGVLPLTLEDAKEHLRISASDTTHDQLLTRAITAATEQLEQDTGRAIIQQTFVQYLNDFPTESYIRLYVKPISAVTGVTYEDTDGSQTLATTVYGFDSARRQLYLKYDQSWPSTTGIQSNVAITMTCGYGTAPSSVPRLIQEALLLQTSEWFYDPAMEDDKRNRWSNAYERIVKRIMRSSYP